MWKDVVTVTQKNAIKMPDNMSFEDGASFIVNYLTVKYIILLFFRCCLFRGTIILFDNLYEFFKGLLIDKITVWIYCISYCIILFIE